MNQWQTCCLALVICLAASFLGIPDVGEVKVGGGRGIGPRRQPPTQPGQYQISFEGLFPEPNLYWMILRDMTVSRSTFLSAEELL